MNFQWQFLDCNSNPLCNRKILFTPTRAPEPSSSCKLSVADSYQFTTSLDSGSISASIIPSTYKVDIATPLPAHYFYMRVEETGSYLISGSTMSGSAQCVDFNLVNLVRDPFSVRKVDLTPTWTYPYVFSGSLVVLSTTRSFTDTSGSFAVDELVPGIYQVDCFGKVTTTFFISVPNFVSTGSLAPCWCANDLLVVKPAKGIKVTLNNLDNSYVLTVSASDARYLHSDTNVPVYSTSSWAVQSQTALTSSYSATSTTSSYAQSSSIADTATTASHAFNAETASYSHYAPIALSASYAANVTEASVSSSWASSSFWAVTASHALSSTVTNIIDSASWASQSLSSSHSEVADLAYNANTASFSDYTLVALYATSAQNASTASYAQSSSWADTASYALVTSASFAVSNSYSSYARYAGSASSAAWAEFADFAISASYSDFCNWSDNATSSISASLAQTASHALRLASNPVFYFTKGGGTGADLKLTTDPTPGGAGIKIADVNNNPYIAIYTGAGERMYFYTASHFIQEILCDLGITASQGFLGDLTGTASWATNGINSNTASFLKDPYYGANSPFIYMDGGVGGWVIRDGGGTASFYTSDFSTHIPYMLLLDYATANRPLIAIGGGIVTSSITTNTELEYVSGSTSNIQNQLNAKANITNSILSGSNLYGEINIYGQLLVNTIYADTIGSTYGNFDVLYAADVLTASLISGSIISASRMTGTASYADFAKSSSWGQFATSSSFADFAKSSSWGQFAPSSSFADFAKSSSYGDFAKSSSWSDRAGQAISASWVSSSAIVVNAISSSFAQSASYLSTNRVTASSDYLTINYGGGGEGLILKNLAGTDTAGARLLVQAAGTGLVAYPGFADLLCINDVSMSGFFSGSLRGTASVASRAITASHALAIKDTQIFDSSTLNLSASSNVFTLNLIGDPATGGKTVALTSNPAGLVISPSGGGTVMLGSDIQMGAYYIYGYLIGTSSWAVNADSASTSATAVSSSIATKVKDYSTILNPTVKWNNDPTSFYELYEPSNGPVELLYSWNSGGNVQLLFRASTSSIEIGPSPTIFDGDVEGGNITASQFYGPLAGTASYATSAKSSSWADNSYQAVSASWAPTQATTDTSSYAIFAGSSSHAQVAITASYGVFATSASYAQSASHSDKAFWTVSGSHAWSASNADRAATASHAEYVTSASVSIYSRSGSYAYSSSWSDWSVTASFSSRTISGSYAQSASRADFGLSSSNAGFATSASWAGFARSSSYATSASWAPGASVTASFALTASQLMEFGFNKSSSINNATSAYVVVEHSTASYGAAFFDYYVRDIDFSGVNKRAGTIVATWLDDGTVEYNEVATTDIGDTTDVTLFVNISESVVRLLSGASSYTWSVTATGRYV